MIHPTDVLSPSVPGPIVLLIDCPTLSHLQDLLSIETLEGYYADSVSCVIHLSPSSITTIVEYRKWMQRFGMAQHIMAGYEIKNMEAPILQASAIVAAHLNYLCPQLFPAPGFLSQSISNITPVSISSTRGSLPNIMSAKNLLKFQLRPYAQLGLDTSRILPVTSPTEIVSKLLTNVPEVVDLMRKVKQLWHDNSETNNVDEQKATNQESSLDSEGGVPSCLDNVRRDDMEIVLLGTGSSQPSKYRNVSAIFINLFSNGSILLDCGEGTLSQLKRRFGVTGADEAIKCLKFIWISHIHADHQAGLIRILSLRRVLLGNVSHDPLIVIGPRPLKQFLDAYQRLEDLDMEFLDCSSTTLQSGEEDLNQRNSHLIKKTQSVRENCMRKCDNKSVDVPVNLLKNMNRVLKHISLDSLISVPVLHCSHSFGVVITASERANAGGNTIPGWKLVYSGDTRPCPTLTEASVGATILIHEATFEDGMMGEAIKKNHSTTSEAIDVGNKAGVYRILLTHFSQRYPKIPVFDESNMHKTCIGFDLMSVNLADLRVLPQVFPYLKQLFQNNVMVGDLEEDLVTEV